MKYVWDSCFPELTQVGETDISTGEERSNQTAGMLLRKRLKAHFYVFFLMSSFQQAKASSSHFIYIYKQYILHISYIYRDNTQMYTSHPLHIYTIHTPYIYTYIHLNGMYKPPTPYTYTNIHYTQQTYTHIPCTLYTYIIYHTCETYTHETHMYTICNMHTTYEHTQRKHIFVACRR